MNPDLCPICNAPIPAHAPGGFCPACLLRDAEEPPITGRAAPTLEEIASAFPQFEVLGLIGQGGMGFVYQVRQPALDRIVALKILSPELGRDPAFAERFAREARVLGKLNHPNIVTVFEHGVSQPSTLNSQPFFYLLMEFVDGVNLRQAMRAGRFTPEQALSIVPGICDALQAAHAQGIWHRDIKPENILLDARGGVKIADFGIARIVGDPGCDFTLTMTGGALGSAAYMAPEQHENPRDVDHRADIYSLGVVIYEMLTGELPLGRFPVPSRRAAVDARIDEIVLRTLEKERELRQQSAEEVKTDVQGAATHAESAAPVAASGDNPSPLARMSRLAVWSLALLVVGGLLLVMAHFMGKSIAGELDARHSLFYWPGQSVPDSVRGVANAVMVLIVLGGGACALSLTGALWRLYEMKRGWVPTTGRWLLIALAIPALAAAEYGLFTIAQRMVMPSLHFLPSAKGPVLLDQASCYGFLSLALASVFYLARPLSPMTSLRRELGIVSIVLAICAAIGSAVLAKRCDSHWPDVFFRDVATLNLTSPGRPSNDQVLASLKRAAAPFAGDYQLFVTEHGAGEFAPHTEVSVIAMTRKPVFLSSAGEKFSHSKACLYRLRDMLPPDTIRGSAIASGDSFPGGRTKALPVLAGLAALLAALAGGRRSIWVVGSGVALHLVLIALPVWPTAQDLQPPRVIDEPPLFPMVAPDLLAPPDFSTPEKAVTSVYDAACFGRTDLVKRGMSKAVVALLDQNNGWAEFMDVYSYLRVVTSLKAISGNGNSAIVDGIIINLSGGNAGSRYDMDVVRENGEWRVASLHGLKTRFGPFLPGNVIKRTTTVYLGAKTNWPITEAASGVNPANTTELHGKLDAETVSGGGFAALTVHVGGNPVFMVVGKGSGNSSQWQGSGRGITGSSEIGRIIHYSIDDGDKATINHRTYNLTRGRIFLIRPDRTLRQIAMRPERVLAGGDLKEFVESLPPESKAPVK